MPQFYHVDARGNLRPEMVLTGLPVTSAKFEGDARAINDLFPHGLSYFGATVMLHMDQDLADAQIEQILETIRRQFQEKCGVNYPSRMASLFACETFDAADRFRANFQRQAASVWLVECADFFRGDMNYVSHEMTRNHDLAVSYWQGKNTAVPFWEYTAPTIR